MLPLRVTITLILVNVTFKSKLNINFGMNVTFDSTCVGNDKSDTHLNETNKTVRTDV